MYACSIKFSTTLQTEILSTETLGFLKQMIILKSFDSVFIPKPNKVPFFSFLVQNWTSINKAPFFSFLVQNWTSINEAPFFSFLVQNWTSINKAPFFSFLVQNWTSINKTPFFSFFVQNWTWSLNIFYCLFVIAKGSGYKFSQH